MVDDIGLFYGSTTGMTEDTALKMAKIAAEKFDTELVAINIVDLDDPNDMFLYDKLIIGQPTWNYGEYQDDWELVVDKIASANLKGKTIAMFGLGDQVGYPEYFLDAMGMLADQLRAQGASFIGEWPTDGYTFESSKALLKNGNFLGLAIDEDTQPELTEARLEKWLAQILPEFASL